MTRSVDEERAKILLRAFYDHYPSLKHIVWETVGPKEQVAWVAAAREFFEWLRLNTSPSEWDGLE